MNRCAFESPDLELSIARPHDQTSHFPLPLHRPQVGSFGGKFVDLAPGDWKMGEMSQLEAHAEARGND